MHRGPRLVPPGRPREQEHVQDPRQQRARSRAASGPLRLQRLPRRSGARAGARAGRDRGDDARGHGQGLAHRQRRLQRAPADRGQPRGRRVPAADDRVRRQPQGHLPRDVSVGGGPQEAVRGHGAPRLLQCGGRCRPRLPAGPHGPADLSDRALQPQRRSTTPTRAGSRSPSPTTFAWRTPIRTTTARSTACRSTATCRSRRCACTNTRRSGSTSGRRTAPGSRSRAPSTTTPGTPTASSSPPS